MLKFLRKYNKYMLVVAGVFLMLTFLLPQAIKTFGQDTSKKTYAHASFGRVTLGDTAHAARELKAITNFARPLTYVLFGTDNPSEVHWLLLAHEAEAGGFVGGPADGEGWIPEVAEQLAELEVSRQYGSQASMVLNNREYFQTNFVAPAVMNLQLRAPDVARASSLTTTQFHAALAKARGVVRMLESYRLAARFSQDQALLLADEAGDQVFVDAMVIPASAIVRDIPDPTDSELQAFFDAHRETPPGGGEHGVGFLGKPSVQLEFIRLDSTAIRDAIVLDDIAVYKFYEQNKAQFPGEFEQVVVPVKAQMRENLLQEIFAEANSAIGARVVASTRALPPAGPLGKYRTLPANWDQVRPRPEELAAAIVDQVKRAKDVTIPSPEVVRVTDWVALDAIADSVPGLGGATIRSQNQVFTTADILSKTRELDTDNAMGLQVGVPFVTDIALSDTMGDRYFFTVTQAKKAAPLDSWEPIRDQVVAEWKRFKAFEQAPARVEAIRSMAARSFDSVAYEFAPPTDPGPIELNKLDIQSQVGVTRGAATLSSRQPATSLDFEAFRNDALEAAERLDPTRPISDADPESRIVITPSLTSLSMIVARITGLSPLTREAYYQNADGWIARAAGREFTDHAAGHQEDNPFTADSLKKRFDFRVKGVAAQKP